MSNIQNIKNAVKAYIEKSNTPYAIMIDGDWGVGKTHLFKKEIVPIIGEKESIYISLFGLQTISDIENEIFRAISFVGEDKDGLFKGILNSNKDVIEDVKIGGIGYAVQFGLKMWKSKKLKTSKSLILCFDDLERWKGELGVCLSYINKLVEHENGKCIVIGSISQLESGKDIEFTTTKEKTIRHIYKLENNSSFVIESALMLIDYADSDSEKYINQLITKNKSRVAHILEKTNYRNIRVVSDSIQFFAYIYKNNQKEFNNSKTSAISYYCCLLAALILFRKYILETDIQQKITSHGDKDSYKLLNEIGYFKKKDPSDRMNAKTKYLLETIFYKDKEIYLEGIFSIIENGFYCDDDFENNFSLWRQAEAYEYYQDTFTFWNMEDDEATTLFKQTENQIFEKKIVTDPNKLLVLSDRIITDIKRGILENDFIETKKKIIALFDDLYQTNRMERVEQLSIYFESNDFQYGKDILDYVQDRNKEYIDSIQDTQKSNFWYSIKSDVSKIDDMLKKFQRDPIFAMFNNPKEIVDTLESLSNSQLLDFTRWMGSRISNPNCTDAVNDEMKNAAILAKYIFEKYSKIYTVRGGHFKQIARILSNRRTDYDPEFVDNLKSQNQASADGSDDE